MEWEMREIAGLVLDVMRHFAPVAVFIGLMGLLNRRDRRQARLLCFVAGQFPGEVLRSDIVIDAHCALLTSRAVVRVDIYHDGGDVWPAIERLRQTLPPMVGLAVREASRTTPRDNGCGGTAPAEARTAWALPAPFPDRAARVKGEVAMGHVSKFRV
jgi:hypothetical protein